MPTESSFTDDFKQVLQRAHRLNKSSGGQSDVAPLPCIFFVLTAHLNKAMGHLLAQQNTGNAVDVDALGKNAAQVLKSEISDYSPDTTQVFFMTTL